MFQVRIGDKLYTAGSPQASSSTPFTLATARAWLQWFSAIYFRLCTTICESVHFTRPFGE